MPDGTIPTLAVPGARQPLLANPMLLFGARALILMAVLGLWEYASGRWIPRIWVSSPSAIAMVLQRWTLDGSLWRHVQATLLASGLGYAAGAASGVAAGLALGLLPTVARVAAPFLAAFYALPKIALAPLLVIMFGIGLESKIVLVASAVFFLLLYSTRDGLRDIDRDMVRGIEIMGASRAEVVRTVLLPGVMPWVFSGLRISVRYAFTAAILGELIAGNQGIGFLIEMSAGQFNSAGVFAAVFVLVVVSVALTELLTRTEASALTWKM